MFNKKNILVLSTAILLTGCALTQPKAPVYDGLIYSKADAQKKIKQQKIENVQPVKPYYVTKKVEQKVYHTVVKGDYVWALGRKYKVSPFDIIKQNNLKKPYTLNKGDRLYIKTITKTIKTKNIQIKETLPENQHYSLTRNSSLYNKNTAQYRQQKSIPRQDLSKVNKNKNLDFGYHKVKRGENLFRIGRKYGVSVFDLMAYNDIKSPQSLQAGQELKIPVAKAPEQAIETTQKHSKDTTLKFDKVDKNLARKKGFIYPVKGRVISKFGVHGHGIRNDGIDIAVPMQTPVRSTQNGTVMYAENVSTLGSMVLLKHHSGYISAYTHNSKLLVKKGDKVVKGQVIALSGNSGNAKQPMLHFELRRYGKAINPTSILR